MKIFKAPKRYRVSDPEHSDCGSFDLAGLDWSRWWTDGGFALPGALYLHVPALPSSDYGDGTIHRVYCRHTDTPRLTFEGGELFWLVDVPDRTKEVKS